LELAGFIYVLGHLEFVYIRSFEVSA